jgi:23S rRNA U2552 (ribose-2'-O)-methylase RlmE/FtsJ
MDTSAHFWENLCIWKRCIIPIEPYLAISSSMYEHHMTEDEKELHECRNRITQYEQSLTNGRNWEYYKKIVNPYEIVYTQRKYGNFPESLCFLKPLSRSYFKMIEMLDLIDFFGPIPTDFRTAHVCEGPGGFIEAVMDEAAKHRKKLLTSTAMTLKSKKSNIPGWRRAATFLQKNKNIHILFGEDQTGDIMKPENQQSFIHHVSQDGKVHLFTADGGFDFSCDYMKQEQMVFPLLMASTKIGLEVLQIGGVFVLKLFDFYHPSTMDLVYFLSCHFEEWTLYKPCMSRPCNPEHYFIGKGFVGCSEKTLDVMRLWCSYLENEQPLESLFLSHDRSEFNQMIHLFQHKSFQMQKEYLERVFRMIDQHSEEHIRQCLKTNEKLSYEWCVRFKVPMYEQRIRSIEE